MRDILPGETAQWQWLEGVVKSVLQGYGYQEIRMPVLEKTELFSRSIGAGTDIVNKEMYTFSDRNDDSLTLRPEGTAGCGRALLQHGLAHAGPLRVWYQGPMFRRERPQKGRLRQFHQVGAEAFGIESPDIDAEMILMCERLWGRLGVTGLRLQINSLGSPASRERYRQSLLEYLSDCRAQLDEDSVNRLETNPLRILDSKNPALEEVIRGAPSLLDAIDDEAAEHFAALRGLLDANGVAYEINPRLVRGLDYYNRTVFEWLSESLGAQGAVCAGGRYDGLLEQLGGRAGPGIGFAMGLERLLELAQHGDETAGADAPQFYLVAVGEAAVENGLRLAERLRDQLPSLRLMAHCGGGSFKSQFKKADRSGAKYALIVGTEEAARNSVSIKPLREDSPQREVTQDALAGEVEKLLQAGP